MNVFNFLEQHFKNFPGKDAIVFKDNRVSYAKLSEMIDSVAACIMSYDLAENAHVAILAQNSIEYIAAYLACFKLGKPPVCLNWKLSSHSVKRSIVFADSALVLYDECFADTVKDACVDSPFEIRSVSLHHAVKCIASGAIPIKDRLAQDHALYLFTSGTTSEPKAVVHTQGSLISYVYAFAHTASWSTDTVYQSSAPLFHISGFSPIMCLLSGGTLVLHDKFSPEDYLKSIQDEHVNRISVVPTTLRKLLDLNDAAKYDISSVKKVVYGTAPMPIQLIRRAKRHFQCGWEQLYGMTEACSICVLRPSDHIQAEPGKCKVNSVGRPINYATVRIIDEQGNELAPGNIGEVLIQSPSLFCGYYKQDEKSSQALRDGWYHSGDIGYLDEDGYLYLVDRKNDMIISGGENIYPKEVETCIYRLEDDIDQVAVVGVEDSVWGEVVTAFVVKKPGSSIDSNTIIQFCKKELGTYKAPKQVYFVDSIPLTSNNKVHKPTLRELGKKLKG